MVKLKFKLKSKHVPDLTQRTDEKKSYGGIQLIYRIYKIYCFNVKVTLRGHTFDKDIIYFKRILGLKTFLRPYKKLWDKRMYRLPFVYWGKKSHPLTRLWVIIPNNFSLGIKKIVPEISLQHQYVKLFGHNVKSKDITSNLFGYKNKFNLNIN